MTKRLILTLIATAMLAGAVGASAAHPLTVTVTVDKTQVRVGDTVKVIWLVNGGKNPFSWIYWDGIWTDDTLMGNQGNRYHSVFEVRPGMISPFSFRIETYDEGAHQEKPHNVLSSVLGLDIVNLDGWDEEVSTRIELDKEYLRVGETVTATVYRSFHAPANDYLGFLYEWLLVDSKGNETLTELKEAPFGEHATALHFTPTKGVGGQLRVYAYEPKFTDDTTTHLYRSTFFTIVGENK